MAQQARPNVMGHRLDSRAQLIICSSDVVMTLSSKRPSSQPMAQPPNKGDCPLFSGSGPRSRFLYCADPVDVAALPQIGEADHEDAEEDRDVGERDPGPRLGRLRRHLAALAW